MEPDWTSALDAPAPMHRFSRAGWNAFRNWRRMLAAGDGEAALAHARGAGEGIADVGVALRRERTALAVALAIGDLAGAFPLDRVMAELSALADRALDAAMAAAVMRRLPDLPREDATTGFIALALGKHGAGELNYSSDIDPILLYDPETLAAPSARRTGRSSATLCPRRRAAVVGRHGGGIRVPRRSAAASGNPKSARWPSRWVRRCRITNPARWRGSGRHSSARAQHRAISPLARNFSTRSSLSSGVAASISGQRGNRQADRAHPQRQWRPARIRSPGSTSNRARRYSRNRVFYPDASTDPWRARSVAAGARDEARTGSAWWRASGLAREEAQTILGTAYDRLRTAEHRIQMVRDQQTHSLPAGEALDSLARLDGFADGAALLDDLRKTTAEVARIFDTLIETDDRRLPRARTSVSLRAQLDTMGFAEGERLAARITGWRDGRFRALRSDARARGVRCAVADLAGSVRRGARSGRALIRFETLLEKLPSAINLFRLLEARPGSARPAGRYHHSCSAAGRPAGAAAGIAGRADRSQRAGPARPGGRHRRANAARGRAITNASSTASAS